MADKITQRMAQFYETCQTQGYVDMKDATQSLKAKVIATDMKLKYGDIVSFYNKAKGCYEVIQEEKAAAEKEAKRKKIGGNLLLTLSAGSDNLKVYVRPDKTIYTVYNDKDKEEGAPNFPISKGAVVAYKYQPSEAIYTGATVGGVTTGGVHYTKAGYETSVKKTNSGIVKAVTPKHRLSVDSVQIAKSMQEAFKRDSQYLSCVRGDGKIVLLNVSDSAIQSAVMRGGSYTEIAGSLNAIIDGGRKSYDFCQIAVSLMKRIISGCLPPSDKVLYEQAVELADKAETSERIMCAAKRFEVIADYMDSAERAKKLRVKYETVLQLEKEEAILRRETNAKRGKKIAIIGVIASIIVTMLAVFLIIPAKHYSDAEKYMAAGDSRQAVIAFSKAKGYKDAHERSMALWNEIAHRNTIAVGRNYDLDGDFAAYVKSDGTVVVVSDPGNDWGVVSSWTDIIAIDVDYDMIVGLKSDGTVVAEGPSLDEEERKTISKWKNAVAISADRCDVFALKSDGTLVCSNDPLFNLKPWRDLVAFTSDGSSFYGVRAYGTVINEGTKENVSKQWTDVIDINFDGHDILGLKKDGTVVAVERDKAMYYKSVEYDWTDIVSVSVGRYHTVGLKSDGTVVAEGDNFSRQCDVSEWTDIAAVYAGDSYTIGLKNDGTAVIVYEGDGLEFDVSEWKNIMVHHKK